MRYGIVGWLGGTISIKQRFSVAVSCYEEMRSLECCKMEWNVENLVSFAIGVGLTIFCYQLEVLRQLVAVKLNAKAAAKNHEALSGRVDSNEEATQKLSARVDSIEKAINTPKVAPALTVVEGGKAQTG